MRRGPVLACVVLLVAGCGGSAPDKPSSAAPTAGLAHVHGIGVDPADGVLYAATHHGLFRIPATGDAVQVAGRAQDTMGFTVAGAGDFLGSGHPDPKAGGPHALGLIRSTDRGETWTSLSLAGEADFHALHAVGGSVYGWDAGTGRLMVSADRTTWQVRSTTRLLDFAVHPSDPLLLVATTQDGLARSRDGGRSFVAGGPLLAFLSWPTANELWGVAPDGTVSVSADAGRTWTRRGLLPGQPEALAVVGTTVYAAVSADAIYVSVDGGRTFSVRHRYLG